MELRPTRVPDMKMKLLQEEYVNLRAPPEDLAIFLYAVDLFFRYLQEAASVEEPLTLDQVAVCLNWLGDKILNYCNRWPDYFCQTDFDIMMEQIVYRMKDNFQRKSEQKQKFKYMWTKDLQDAVLGVVREDKEVGVNVSGIEVPAYWDRAYPSAEEVRQKLEEIMLEIGEPDRPLGAYGEKELETQYVQEKRIREWLRKMTAHFECRAMHIEAICGGKSPDVEDLELLADRRMEILSAIRRWMDPRFTKPVALLPVNLSSDLLEYIGMIVKQYPEFGQMVTIESHGYERYRTEPSELFARLLDFPRFMQQVAEGTVSIPPPLAADEQYEERIAKWKAIAVQASARTIAPLAIDRIVHDEIGELGHHLVDKDKFFSLEGNEEVFREHGVTTLDITLRNQKLAGERSWTMPEEPPQLPSMFYKRYVSDASQAVAPTESIKTQTELVVVYEAPPKGKGKKRPGRNTEESDQ